MVNTLLSKPPMRWSAAPDRAPWRKRLLRPATGLALLATLSGCQTQRESSPPRTATEQLLISTAADSALKDLDFSWLKAKKIFVEEKYFDSYDKGYVMSLIRERISAAGGLLTSTNADVVVEIRSGALSIDNSELLVGLPAMTLPVPLTGPVPTPEVAIYSRKSAKSIAKLALFAYERASSKYIKSVGPFDGTAFFRLYRVLIVSWRRSDVPELLDKPPAQYSKVPPPSSESR